MQNIDGKQQQTKTDDDLKAPQPPVTVEVTEDAEGVTEKVQDHDWNNGRMEVTSDETEVLDSHKEDPEPDTSKNVATSQSAE